MDQDSTKGPDKRNWRERLGIGKQELPRIAEEFKDEVKAVEKTVTDTIEALGGPATPAPGAARPAPRVVKPAPMAPHVARPAPAPAPVVEEKPMAPAAESRPAARAPETRRAAAPPDPLADKLRAQRAAAERLAEQRVQAARARAEAVRRQTPQPPVPPGAPPPSIIAEGRNAPRPKYSFADDEPQRPMPPHRPAFPQGGVYPPQQPYGGGGLNPNLQRPAPPYPPGPPGYRPQPQQAPQGFRPIDPATGYPMQPGYLPPGVNRSYPGQVPGAAMPPPGRLPPRSAEVPFAPPAQRAPVPAAPRRQQRSLPPAPVPAAEADIGDDIFDSPPRPQPRPGVSDYTQAYQEMEDAFIEEPRRSAGPWVLLLLLMLAAAVAGAGVWFYQTNIKTAGKTGTDTVPVVEAPQQPGKVATEPAPVADPAATPAAPSRKAIYDRIVGDQEVLGGQMTPTEEAPVQPAGQSQPIPDPTGDATPLPLPPPPGGDGTGSPQGSLTGSQTTDTAMNVAPASDTAADKADGAAQPETPTATAANEGQATPLPVKLATSDEQISDPEPAAAKPVTARKATTSKPKTTDPYANLGARPVVLVPPSQTGKQRTKVASAPAMTPQAPDTPAPTDISSSNSLYGSTAPSEPATAATAPKKKGGGILDLFNGNRTSASAPAPQPLPQDQVAAIAPPPAAVTTRTAPQVTATTPPAASTGAGGYVVQLASFRSQSEATTESNRFRSRHSGLLGGLSPIISEASVAGSTRYRLAFGPLPSRSDANRLCSQLFAAGERDCLVRSK